MEKKQLLLIPGPTPVLPEILDSLSQPTISHVSPVFVSEFKEALSELKKIVFCEEGEPFLIAGAGTLAMEMALINTAAKGERILVLSQGYFGKRMAQIAQCFNLDMDILEAEERRAVPPEKLESRLSQGNYSAVVATHVDTATGVCSPVQDYAEAVKKGRALFIVDGVCATGGIEERMDDWGVDVVLTAAQKCFGVPPGLAVLVVSKKGMEKRRSLESVPGYYSDLLNWLPIMKDPARYFSTPCVNEIRAFHKSAKMIMDEGLHNRFVRHNRTSRAIRRALQQLGFSFFPEERFFADTLSVVFYPDGIEDETFRKTLAVNGVIVAGGLGNLKGEVFRMGHMGNLSVSQVYFALEMLEKTLSSGGYRFESGTGVEAARSILDKTKEG